MSKVTLRGHIVVPDDDFLAVEAELVNHIALTRAEQGCLVFEVTPDPENKNILYVYEEFVDQNAFEAHQQRVKSSQWGKISVNVGRHFEISVDD